MTHHHAESAHGSYGPYAANYTFKVQECEGRGTLGTVPASLGQPELASEDFVLLLGFSLKIFIN